MALASGNLNAGLALFDCQRKEVPLGLNLYWSRRNNNGSRLQIKGWRSTGFGLLKLQSGRVRIQVKAVAPTETASDSESATSSSKKPNNLRRPGEKKGFVEEMRFVAMRLHTKDQAKEGEKEPESPPVIEWKPTIEGYLKFLVDSKLVFDTLEDVVEKAVHPSYTIFRNTGLERSAALAKDLEWFKEQGHSIPEPGKEGKAYADYLAKIAGENPPAFVCHYYNTYFAHSAGGRFIGKKVASMILDAKVLEFYKWDGDLPELLASVKEKLNKVAEEWTREQKDHCLEETEKSFKFSGSILQQIIT